MGTGSVIALPTALLLRGTFIISSPENPEPEAAGERSSAEEREPETSSHACEVAECRDKVVDSFGGEWRGEGVGSCIDGGRGSVEVVGSYAVCAKAFVNGRMHCKDIYRPV